MVVAAFMGVVAAFTVVEVAVSTQRAEASAVASVADHHRHPAWVQAPRAPRQVRRCARVAGRLLEAAGMNFDPQAARRMEASVEHPYRLRLAG
jgi:hypothetical protein